MRSLSVHCAILAWLFGYYCAQAQTVAIDNEWIHSSRVTIAPHAELAAADHPDTVIVDLTSREASFRKGGRWAERNSSGSTVEEVLVELKANAPPRHSIQLDPTKLDGQHHVIILENGRVRIIRNTLQPGIKGPMHEHPAYAVVYLTDLHTSVTQADGRVVDNVHKRGEVTWRDSAKHAVENIGPTTAYEIQIELK